MQIVTLTGKLSCGNFSKGKIAAVFLFMRQKERMVKMKTKKLLSIILCMVIVLGASLFPVSADSNTIVHNIAEKYSGENLVDDPNMMWFVAEEQGQPP